MKEYNKYLIKKNYLYNMHEDNNLTYKQLINLLKFPNKVYYYNNKKIPKNIICNILDNRNTKELFISKKGIIINRCYGKYLPSDIILYNKITDDYFDRNQATELQIGLPIYILHVSKDKQWYLVKTYNYICWVYYENVAKVNNEIFNKYLDSNKFIVVIDKMYVYNDKHLDMGVKLPIYDELETTTKIILPTKKNDKYFEHIIEIDNNYISKGYIKYTKYNLIIQAIKYFNTPYGWGGINNGIDCSGFISNIYKTFGIYLPRDTKYQEKIIGTKIYKISDYTYNDKKNLLYEIDKPSILFMPGHVMLLIDRTYIIHASSINKKVIISEINDDIINKLTSIHTIEFDKIKQ